MGLADAIGGLASAPARILGGDAPSPGTVPLDSGTQGLLNKDVGIANQSNSSTKNNHLQNIHGARHSHNAVTHYTQSRYHH